MLAWILEHAGLAPGFLIGGVPKNFGISARSPRGESPFFVIEADEYDTAFFDKRSKFVHYRTRTAILNNLEHDHADIFPDVASIQTQFHHLVRTVPANGLIVSNGRDERLKQTLAMGCWSAVEEFGPGLLWDFKRGERDAQFSVLFKGADKGLVDWGQMGAHNTMNALAAIAAARHAGVPTKMAIDALSEFTGVARRMENKGEIGGVTVYDDFAHHPTAIQATLAGLKKRVGNQRVFAVLEPRTNTMKLGTMRAVLPNSLALADVVFVYAKDLGWDVAKTLEPIGTKTGVFEDLDAMVSAIVVMSKPGDQILVMSNGGFGGVHGKILAALAARHMDEKH
jgi:UDP-N-acetylmuramate: L-alanyl-gamma-D-glutamyl-meso-diaminopimelate ligase